MMIKTLIVLQQEIGETKEVFLDKVEQIEKTGYHTIDQKCYDVINKLAEITLVRNFDFKKTNNGNFLEIENNGFIN